MEILSRTPDEPVWNSEEMSTLQERCRLEVPNWEMLYINDTKRIKFT